MRTVPGFGQQVRTALEGDIRRGLRLLRAQEHLMRLGPLGTRPGPLETYD